MIFEISHGKRFSKISGKTPKKMSPQKVPGEKNFFLPPGVLRQLQRMRLFILYPYRLHTGATPAQYRQQYGGGYVRYYIGRF
jgi:hypothetical protein|nr:MAG TPA: hypothetical protein [Caudoviricetes sp.]